MMPHDIDIADVLFVATDLTVLSEWASPATLEDFDNEGRIYRPLDPMYYAWLRTRMELAQAACSRGKLTSQAFDALRTRFNPLHDQAVALFGESSLLEAVRLMDPKSYAPPGRTRTEPEEHTHAEIPEAEQPDSRCSPEAGGIPGEAVAGEEQPAPQVSPPPREKPQDAASLDGWSKHAFPDEDPERFRSNQRISKYALAQVDAVRDQATALGWTEAELYQTRGRFAFPCGGQYGLVCFIHRDQRVGKVTKNNIEIVYPDGHALRLYRKEVTA